MSEAVKRYWLESFMDDFYKARQFVLASDHDRIVVGLQAQVEQLTAERARWVENAEALGGKCDQLEERCRELEEEARAPLCFCGMPMAKNTHPDAGKPGQLLEVGAVYVCIPCLSKANHGHAKSANALRAEVERLKPLLKEAGEELNEYDRAVIEAGTEPSVK